MHSRQQLIVAELLMLVDVPDKVRWEKFLPWTACREKFGGLHFVTIWGARCHDDAGGSMSGSLGASML